MKNLVQSSKNYYEDTGTDKAEKPYLSVVMPSRNDEHGGNTLRRTQVAIGGLLEQLERHKIDSEFILVEWNPPVDKPLLKEAIRWPKKLKFCTIRTIVVPPSIHQRYKYWDKMPFHFSVAHNTGIRRSRGRFVLPAAIDLLYSDELMEFIAAKALKEDERYRTNRCDVEREVIQCGSLEEQLEYCRNHIIRIKSRPMEKVPWYVRWRYGNLPLLHTSAAGDFFLMSRDRWRRIHGFREADIGNAHVDGLFCFMAHAAGIREVVLSDNMQLYHIDHADKHGDRTRDYHVPLENWFRLPFLPEGVNEKITYWYGRLLIFFGYTPKSYVYVDVPTLSFLEYRKIAREMLSGKRSYICNDENWGLRQETLEEYVINRAAWDN